MYIIKLFSLVHSTLTVKILSLMVLFLIVNHSLRGAIIIRSQHRSVATVDIRKATGIPGDRGYNKWGNPRNNVSNIAALLAVIAVLVVLLGAAVAPVSALLPVAAVPAGASVILAWVGLIKKRSRSLGAGLLVFWAIVGGVVWLLSKLPH